MKDIRQLVLFSFLSSVIIAGKVIMAVIPNVEIVTFLLIIYTLVLGFNRAFLISIVYVLTEFLIYGFGVQLYIWLLIVVITALFKGIFRENFILWSLYSGFMGLIFGFLCAIPKLLIGISAFYTFFIGGLLFDAIHMIGNYGIMLLIGKPIYTQLKKLVYNHGGL